MLKIVYPVCCGLDVHKSFVYACIASTDEKGVTTYSNHRFPTFTNSLKNLALWLAKNNCSDVCMESTGKYWIPVFNILEQTCNVVLAHPKYVKAIRGKKTDKKDAKWIADLFKHDLIAGSFIPPLAIRQLRDLMRYHFKHDLVSPSFIPTCSIRQLRDLMRYHVKLTYITPAWKYQKLAVIDIHISHL